MNKIIPSLNERFKSFGVKNIDSKNRMNLGDKIINLVTKLTTNVDAFEVFVGAKGDVLLRPVVNIPSGEAWIYKNPKVLKQIRKGLEEAGSGKVEKVDNLDDFFESL
ncbi:MAG: hypothetical protein KJ915_01585 [Candidatus Omnitrophica bacterium]|nr:hypothetical protein [Candidatus Omnitrophota bacterium]